MIDISNLFQESDEVNYESYARIEHVITGYWLHALRGRPFVCLLKDTYQQVDF